MWTAEALLDHTQDLLGEPTGAFYNISTRLAQMNAYQRQLVHDTRAITAVAELTWPAGANQLALPEGFLSFSQETPLLDGQVAELISLARLEAVRPGWQLGGYGPPYLLAYQAGLLRVSPAPESSVSLYLPYVKAPADMVAMSDRPFDGLETLDRFAPLLALKVAATLLLTRAPQVASALEGELRRGERQMTHFVRANPQQGLAIRPIPYRS